jgi:hypothetical protein
MNSLHKVMTMEWDWLVMQPQWTWW